MIQGQGQGNEGPKEAGRLQPGTCCDIQLKIGVANLIN